MSLGAGGNGVGGDPADAAAVGLDRPPPQRLALQRIGDARRDGAGRLRQPELGAVAQDQREIDRLRREQRQRDQQRHLPGEAARPDPQSRVTSAANV